MSLQELCKEYNAILTKFNQKSNQNCFERLNKPKNQKLRLNLNEKKDDEKECIIKIFIPHIFRKGNNYE